MRKFVGITTDADIIPDETTILRFRRLLEIHQLTEALFAEVNGLLSERGLFVGKGTIVDATLIHAPSSTKNAQKKRDPEMHQTRKGKQSYFGMKMHTGVDAGSGLVHTIQATAANVHDATVLPELLHGNEDALYGDSAYHSKALEALALLVGLSFYVCKRGSRGHPLTERERMRNRRYSRVRAIVEHPYLVVKRLWGHAKHATAGSRRIWRKCIRCLPWLISTASDIVCWPRRSGASMKCKKRRNRCGEARNRGARRSWAHIFCNLMRSPPSSFNYNRIFRASLMRSSRAIALPS